MKKNKNKSRKGAAVEEKKQHENVQSEVQQETKDSVKEKEEVDLEKELAEWKDKYLRLQAEFDNFRKRNIKERADILKRAGGEVIFDILPVLDDFERAIAVNDGKGEDDVEAIKEGFHLIYQKLKKTLESKGLKAMNAQGDDFDPEYHQAVTQIEAGEDMVGKVVEEVEKGYYLNDNILRFAKAVVGK